MTFRRLLWVIDEDEDGNVLSRTLIDKETGEVLDRAWRESMDSPVESYSALREQPKRCERVAA